MPPAAVAPAGLTLTERMTQTAAMPHVVYIATAGLLLLVVAIFAVMLMRQRRRRRAQMLLALAEDAERRRKKRRRAGLRSAEIDRYCPELIVVPAGSLPAATPAKIGSDAPYASADGHTDVPDDEEADPPASGSKDPPPPELPVVHDDASRASTASERVPAPVALKPGDEMCVVCLDEMTVDQLVRRLPCGHTFHSSCIRLWLRRKNACPCCCKTVVKRKRKRKKPRVTIAASTSVQSVHIQAESPLPEMPIEPPRAASFSARRPHRTASAGRMFATSRSAPFLDPERIRMRNVEPQPVAAPPVDRPRPPGNPGPFARVGSLLDPDNPNGEVLNSEASSHFDETMAGHLLDQVRQELRGEPGDGLSTDGDVSDMCLDFEDDDSLLFDSVRLNRPFRGHSGELDASRPSPARTTDISDVP